MKNIFPGVIAILFAIALNSCSSDDSPAIAGNGELSLEFDHAYGNNDLIFGVAQTANSQGEILKVGVVKYIVSNIKLTAENGAIYTYPKSESYFIIDESDPAKRIISLLNVPAGNYSKVTFGIGVDQAQFELGAPGQGDFLAEAQAADLLWSWSAGYKFFALEGSFASATTTAETPFMIHTGKTGTDYNYTEITLNLPTTALVRSNVSPIIHIVADVSKIADGQNTIKLEDYNMGGMGAMIMGGAALPLVTENLNGVFSIDHVHNDENAHSN